MKFLRFSKKIAKFEPCLGELSKQQSSNQYIFTTMSKSALQIARANYTPKMPHVLNGNVQPKEGAATTSVSDQEAIRELFPNTYGMPIVGFEKRPMSWIS